MGVPKALVRWKGLRLLMSRPAMRMLEHTPKTATRMMPAASRKGCVGWKGMRKIRQNEVVLMVMRVTS